jgi:cell wall-associated NlpC family hydrolase
MKFSGKVWLCLLALPFFMSCVTVMPGNPPPPISAPVSAPENTAEVRQAVLNEGEKYIDVPYGSPPNVPATFDCSGFINYTFTRAANIPLSPSTKAYLGLGREIEFKDAKPGDILVFASQPGGSNVDHVAILYKKSESGELRGSWLLHAVSIPIQTAAIKGDPYKDGVKIGELGKRGDGVWQNEYFLSRYMTTRRVIEE